MIQLYPIAGVVLLLSCLRAFPVAWTNLMSPLMAADVQHWCAPPNASLDRNWWREHGIPRESNASTAPLKQCEMFLWVPDPSEPIGGRIDFSETVPCSGGWHYDQADFGLTATERWNLVCGDTWKRSAMQTIVMAGSLAGVLIFGRMSDSLGRKLTFFIGTALLMATGTGASFAPSYILFNSLRFVMAAATAGLTAAIVTLFMELMPEKDRIYINIGFGIGYAVPIMFIPLLSYYLKDFRNMQLAIGLSGLLLIPFFFSIHESPKWLLAKHRISEAERVIRAILRTNRRPMPKLSELLPSLTMHAETKSAVRSRNLGLTDIARIRVLRKTTLIVGFNWFFWAAINYYFAVNAHRMPGNPHWNFAISTLSDFPSALIGMYLIRHCRRKQSQIFNIVMAGCVHVLVFSLDDSYKMSKVWGTMLARVFVSTYGFIVWVSVHEIYATPVRSAGFAVAMMFSRIGAGFAPFVKDIGDWTHPYVPCVLIVSFCFGIVFCVRHLPETLNKRLPDTVADMEMLYDSDTEDNQQPICS